MKYGIIISILVFYSWQQCLGLEGIVFLDKEQIISAEVIMQPASGKSIDGTNLITSENINELAPSSESVDKAKKIFTEVGFDVGVLVGISFSITAPVRTFEKVFKICLKLEKGRDLLVIKGDGTESSELPLRNLPKQLTEIVTTITFIAPPDFGPNEF